MPSRLPLAAVVLSLSPSVVERALAYGADGGVYWPGRRLVDTAPRHSRNGHASPYCCSWSPSAPAVHSLAMLALAIHTHLASQNAFPEAVGLGWA